MYSVRIRNGAAWNSFFDIGKLVSEEEYLHVESLYIDLLLELAREMGIKFFTIKEFENYDAFALREGEIVGLERLSFVIQAILRDECWGKLVNDGLEIHFGYDYIMYVVVKKTNINVKPILNRYGEMLVIDELISPYLSNDQML
ncbi:hypothetical protein [Porphyromonas sp. oral taxon 275]|uniref:hypothetical protein n=1 Tax=Porphyromonas sp. oral taxon 275 TaxID=712435 RepID=UPI001BAB6FDF|nr:hypothetical protein [Porphyromonas sp. oral taxon 275]QUB43001.1 hypothetical protein J4862_08460 [Porphyromonas sp. oral taxon 275]